jgi:ribonuclease D
MELVDGALLVGREVKLRRYEHKAAVGAPIVASESVLMELRRLGVTEWTPGTTRLTHSSTECIPKQASVIRWSPMSAYTYIADDSGMSHYLQRLKDRDVREIALDIEGEFNLHVYGERFCLLQLFDGSEEVVVDPLTTSSTLIKELLENRNILKITYDSASDRVLLAKTHQILMNSILDLRPAVELLEYQKNDLKSVLEASIGVNEPGNKKRFQQYDWTRRPINAEAMEYALQDVRFLFPLKDFLLRRLYETGRLEPYILENTKRQDHPPEVDRKPGVFRSGRHRKLSRAQQREFQRIYDIRDRHARELDLPPNTVVANNHLFALVTGDITLASIRGNRRVPDERLEVIKREIEKQS